MFQCGGISQITKRHWIGALIYLSWEEATTMIRCELTLAE